MKLINVIKKEANLKLVDRKDLEIEESPYKGHTAPCIVFEDENGDIFFVARTRMEFYENIDRKPPTKEELVTQSKRAVLEMLPRKIIGAKKQIIGQPDMTDEELQVQLDLYCKKYDHAVRGLKIQPTEEELNSFNQNLPEGEQITLEAYRVLLLRKEKLSLFNSESYVRGMTQDGLRELIVHKNTLFENAREDVDDLIAAVKKKLLDQAEQIESISQRDAFLQKVQLVDEFDITTPVEQVLQILEG